jgi:hypothetical protein
VLVLEVTVDAWRRVAPDDDVVVLVGDGPGQVVGRGIGRRGRAAQVLRRTYTFCNSPIATRFANMLEPP